ncbi:MAG: N-acetyltransferase, partial [Lachnospiraceae bacterium]|nr:N-acetyltransferase [Lachnospiraceae bacterium]
MLEVREVKTRRERKEFVEFPLKMYQDNPCFVPPFYGDEMKIFRKDYVYNDMCESVFFNAYRDGKIVGRISGILQRVSNEIRNEKRVRFTRFDAID